jgi:hypothetical protein
LSDRGAVWAGVDIGYWFTWDDHANARAMQHFTFAAVIRARPF